MFNFFLSQFKDFRLIAKYITSGSIAALSQLGMLIFLVERIHLWHISAVIYAFLFSALIAFALQKFWTFRDHSMSDAHLQVTLYLFLALTELSINVALMYIFVDVLHLWYIPAQIITIGAVTCITFLCNKNIIFKKKAVLTIKEIKE